MDLIRHINYEDISKGFLNGVGVVSAIPIIKGLIGQKRIQGDVWKTAIAAGTFIGSYRLLTQNLNNIGSENNGSENNGSENNELNKQKKFVSGALACSLALMIDDSFIGSFSVSWLGLRAIRTLLPSTDLGPVAIMSGAASILCPAAFLHNDEHQKQYQKFMNKMGFNLSRVTLIDQNNPILNKKSIHGWNKWILCDELHSELGVHPTTSCLNSALLGVAPKIFLISLKLYGPLYFIFTIIKLKNPNIYRLLQNILQSSIFLTGYTLTQYLGVMWFMSTIKPNISRWEHASFAWLGGLWTLVERKERRPELATYCAAHAINSLYIQGKKNKYYGNFDNRFSKIITYVLVILSSGLLTSNINQQPTMIRKIIE